MMVIGTIEEINEVLKFFNPKYPEQKLGTIQSNDCFYVLNGVPVELVIQRGGDTENGQQ